MANFVIYSQRIRLQLSKGKKLALAQDLSSNDAVAFEKFIFGALETLKQTGTGRRLLSEIDNSPHICTVFAGDDTDDNCAKANPDDIANGLARMVVNFRPLQKNIPETVRSLKNPQRPGGKGALPADEAAPIIKKYHDYKADLKQLGIDHGLPTTKQDGWNEFVNILRRADQKGGRMVVNTALQRCGLTYDSIRDLHRSGKSFNDDTYYKLCFALYEYLTPGPGCDTQVRIQMPGIFEEKNHDLYADVKKRLIGKDKKAWSKLSAILLGHELIHAWRMMTGRRIVDDGYDEELMTVGFGPAAMWPLTENAIRRDLRVGTRPGYQPLTRYFAPMMKEFMNNPQADIGF